MKNAPKAPGKKKTPPPSATDAVTAARDKQLQNDPFAPANLRKMGIRIGLAVLVLWGLSFLLNGWIPKAVAGVLTLAIAGVVFWALRMARSSQKVQGIMREAGTAEERKQAISKLETDFKKDDTSAAFAKAQLQMQEDPREALRTLEGINLDRVMAPMADQARAQRAMIHLLLGETENARQLVDGIDLSRHKETQQRASIAAIIGEAWARSGQAKRAVELLETFDPADEAYVDLKPQLLRARAFAYAWMNNMKQMRQTLRTLSQVNPQYLTGFITKKKLPGGVSPRGVHPMLEKEAFEMVQRSGMVPRRMEVRR